MVKRILTAGLFLFAASAWAQPTPNRHPPKYTVATAPSCVDGEPKLYAVTDAASTASCTVAAVPGVEVICQCLDGTASVVGSGSGSASNSFETINAPAGTDPVADSATDTLNITCAGGLTCTGTAATDTLDFTMGTASAATALAANGANCSAGNYPLGVDASGAAESCTADDDLPDADEVTEAMLKAVNAATDEYLLTYESTTGDFEWAQHAPTASALAADPADCAANQYANAIAASGALTCAAIADADVPDSITVTLAGTATALAANGANCSAGQYPLGVDASGAVESCTADSTTPGSDAVTEAMLKAVDAAGDEECLTYESTVGDFEWQSCDSTTYIGGSTGATDDAILIADGTGGATAAASAATLTAAGTVTIPVGQRIAFGGTTSAFPAIQRYSTTDTLQVILADASQWSGVSAKRYEIDSQATLQGNADPYFSTAPNPTAFATFRAAKLVTASTAGSGAPKVLAWYEVGGNVWTNEGATAKAYFTLPTALAGSSATFIVQDADGLRLTAGASDTIRIGATVSSAAGYCESTTIGDSVTIVAINAVEWVAVALIGSGWTCA